MLALHSDVVARGVVLLTCVVLKLVFKRSNAHAVMRTFPSSSGASGARQQQTIVHFKASCSNLCAFEHTRAILQTHACLGTTPTYPPYQLKVHVSQYIKYFSKYLNLFRASSPVFVDARDHVANLNPEGVSCAACVNLANHTLSFP